MTKASTSSKLVVITLDKSVLLVFKDEYWSFLSEQRFVGETERECVLRGITEELKGLRIQRLWFWKRFNGNPKDKKKSRSKKQMNDAVFLARGWGRVEPNPNTQELSGVGWFKDWRGLKLRPTALRILKELERDGYLKR